MAISPSIHYLIDSAEYPKDLLTKLDRTFGNHSEDQNSTLESTPSTTRVLYPRVLVSTLSDEVFQDEEEAEASTQSIRIKDSLHVVTPSLDAPEVHEIFDITSPHIYET